MYRGLVGLLGVVVWLATTPVWAHGYQYLIQVQSTLVLNPEGRLSTLQQVWRYDQPTTQILMDGLGIKDPTNPAELLGLKEQLVKDLADLAYFMELRFNQTIAPRAFVQNAALKVEQGQLVLTLEHPLTPPLNLKGELVIDMADPTGVGIPYHGSVTQVVLPESLKARCKVAIEPRQSLKDLVNFEHGKPAEWVKIHCSE